MSATAQDSLLLIYFGELILKGKNRYLFINQLITNIKANLTLYAVHDYQLSNKTNTSILLEVKPTNKQLAVDALKHVFGISVISEIIALPQDLEVLKTAVLEELKLQKATRFYIRCQRQYKQYSLTSLTLEKTLGSYICQEMSIPVDMENGYCIRCSVPNDHQFYIWKTAIVGQQGLPTNVNGNALCLLSGGIDSIVSSYLMLKRGLSVNYIHFFVDNQPVGEKKLEQLITTIKPYHATTKPVKLYLVDIATVMHEIKCTCLNTYWTVILKIFFLQIAEEIAQQNNFQALITGDALGQVASQTLDNLVIMDEFCNKLILRPLLAYDKAEIIQLAKSIGTYEISIQKYEDCCTLFLPKYPSTKSKSENIKAELVKIFAGKLLINDIILKATKTILI